MYVLGEHEEFGASSTRTVLLSVPLHMHKTMCMPVTYMHNSTWLPFHSQIERKISVPTLITGVVRLIFFNNN